MFGDKTGKIIFNLGGVKKSAVNTDGSGNEESDDSIEGIVPLQ
jgi:hypothetical protein